MRIGVFAVLISLLLAAPFRCGKQPSGIAATSVGRGTARDVASSECLTTRGTFCLVDTAYRRRADGFESYASGSVLWFGRSGDSLVLSADALGVQTTIGDDKSPAHNNVPTYHGRVPRDGTITIWTTMQEERGDSVPYTLRAEVSHASPSPSSLESTGQTARLIIPSPGPRKYEEISIVPVSRVHAGLDRSAWKTFPGSYLVALTLDSLYEVCLLPCASSDTIELKANRLSTWKP